MVEPDEPYSRAYVRYALGLIFLVAVFNVCDRTIMSVLAIDIQASLALSDRQLGWLMGPTFTTVHLLAGIPIARLADRGSRRAIIGMGLLAWSAMTAAAGLAQTFVHMLVARMGVGVGEAAGGPPSQSLISDYMPPERRARGLSLITIGSMVGMGVGMVAGGWINEVYGWRTAFLSVGLPGCLIAVLVFFTLRDPPRGLSDRAVAPGGGESMVEVIRYLLARPSYRWLVLGACAAGMLGFGKNFWEPTFLRRVYGMESGEAGTWYFVIGPLPSVLGTVVGAVVADRLGQRDARWYMWMSGIVALVSFPLSAAWVLWPEDQRIGAMPVAFVIGVIASLFTAMWSPCVMAMGQGLAKPHMRALSAAFWTMVFNFVGMGLGPLLVGELTGRLEPAYGDGAVRYALAWLSLAPVAASVFFTLSARTLREDLALARGHA